MSRTFSLRQLSEGIRDRNVGAEGQRLIEKWTRTGLLRGLNEYKRETMSRLLENQAAQVIREANVLGSAGSVLVRLMVFQTSPSQSFVAFSVA